jgi:hypothetical protein
MPAEPARQCSASAGSGSGNLVLRRLLWTHLTASKTPATEALARWQQVAARALPALAQALAPLAAFSQAQLEHEVWRLQLYLGLPFPLRWGRSSL